MGYLLVHVRLLRFEEHLQKLGGIRTLDDRLKVLVEAIEQVKLDRLESRLEQLHEDLEGLREATSNVREAVVEIPSAPRQSAPPAESGGSPEYAASESPAARVLALVETRLLGLGYRNVQVLSELSGVTDNGDIDVQIECEQGGMATKGRVQIRNFGVRDIALQSVAPMFP